MWNRLLPAALLSFATTLAAAAPPYDASVALRIDWAEGTRGRSALREDITRATVDALFNKGCFRDFQSGDQGSSSELQLDVELWDLIEDTMFDDSIAQRADPATPKPALRVTAHFSLFVGWTLRAGDASIASKRFKIDRYRRPMTEDEDATEWVRSESIEATGRELARAVCSVSRKKIDAARAASPR